MKKLKYVEQLDEKGCIIACMAMIVGMKYFELRQFLWENDKKIVYPNNAYKGTNGVVGMFCGQFKEILNDLFGIKTNWIQFTSLRAIKKHCVLFVEPIQHEFSRHCLIFDVNKQQILDPSPLMITTKKLCTTKLSGGEITKYNVTQCLEIQ